MGISAAAMLASCSNDENLELARNSQVIQFDSFVNKETRTVDISNDNFRKFQVWGLMEKDGQTGQPFTGTEVTSTDGSTWSYTTPVYWEDGYKYSFVAIAPEATGSNWTLTAPTSLGQWGSIAFDNGDGTTDQNYHIDDTYATTPVTLTDAQSPAKIDFQFIHMLSRLQFAFKNALADGSTLNVTDVTIINANVKANAALGENVAWTLADDNIPAALDFGNVILDEGTHDFAGNETKETNHKYMIPAVGADQSYTVRFTVTRDHHGVTDTYNHEVTLPAIEWKAGNSYAFVATLDASNIDPDTELCEIVFSAQVTPWEDFNNPATDIP